MDKHKLIICYLLILIVPGSDYVPRRVAVHHEHRREPAIRATERRNGIQAAARIVDPEIPCKLMDCWWVHSINTTCMSHSPQNMCDGFRREYLFVSYQALTILHPRIISKSQLNPTIEKIALQLPQDYPVIRDTKALMRVVVKPQWVEKNAVFQVFYSVSYFFDYDNFDA